MATLTIYINYEILGGPDCEVVVTWKGGGSSAVLVGAKGASLLLSPPSPAGGTACWIEASSGAGPPALSEQFTMPDGDGDYVLGCSLAGTTGWSGTHLMLELQPPGVEPAPPPPSAEAPSPA